MSRMPPRRPLAQTSRGLPLPTGGEETRAITLAGRDLALSLHPLIWDGVADICAREGLTQRELLEALLERSGRGALKRTVETAVAAYYMAAFPNAGTACSPERSVAPAEPTKPS